MIKRCITRLLWVPVLAMVVSCSVYGAEISPESSLTTPPSTTPVPPSGERVLAQQYTYLFDVPEGEFLAVFPPGASLLPLPDAPIANEGITWVKVEAGPDLAGWVDQNVFAAGSPPTSTSSLEGAVRQTIMGEGRPLGIATSEEAIGFYGVTNGETKTVEIEDLLVDAVKVFYLNQRAQVRSVWINLGLTVPDGAYHPAAVLATDAIETGWTTREAGLKAFEDRQYLVHASFSVPEILITEPLQLDWDRCSLEGVICRVGQALETRTQAGSQLLLNGENPPDSWVALNWNLFRIRSLNFYE